MPRSVLALVALAPFWTAACESVATRAPRPVTVETRSDLAGLFPSDAQSMNDGQIARALDATWTVPDDFRVALVELGHRSEFVDAYAYGWSTHGFETRGLSLAREAVERIASIDGVFDASYLPSFMVPTDPDIASLRTAAARYQADWLLVYSAIVRAEPDYRFFDRDELDGICLVECAVIDTRSGLVLFTSRSIEPVAARAAKGEAMPALVERAERTAVDSALLTCANDLAAFVDAALRTEARTRRDG